MYHTCVSYANTLTSADFTMLTSEFSPIINYRLSDASAFADIISIGVKLSSTVTVD